MIQRGFSKDLPVRPAHSLQLDWWITQRNIINIWLPEGVFSNAGTTEWFLLRDATDLRWTCGKDGAWESRFEMQDRCEVITRTREREDGIDFTIRLTNRSERTWPNANMPVCVQLATAPDFRDPELERTYYHTRNGWRKFDPKDVKLAYPGGCHFFGGMRVEDKGEFERVEIRVASKCGRWFIAHSFDNAISVGGNCHETICCLHANPVVGELKPSETKESRGWLRVRKESVDAAPLQ